MRRLAPLLFVLFLVAAFGCGPEQMARITVVDDVGRATYFEKSPARVVSLSPASTEILFSLGLGDRVVGLTDACDYPEEAKARPKVGGYFSTSLEAILDKAPDLVLTDGYDPVGERLLDFGIPVVVLQPKDIFGIFRDVQVVGTVTRRAEEAARFVAGLQERLDAVADRTARAATSPTVFYEVDGSDPGAPWTAGPGSFIDTLISLAGGRNIAKGGGEWFQLSLEVLAESDPDIIILGDYPHVRPEEVKDRGAIWEDLRAVRSGRVHAISDPDLTSRPGPRIIDGLEELARLIHPELFP